MSFVLKMKSYCNAFYCNICISQKGKVCVGEGGLGKRKCQFRCRSGQGLLAQSEQLLGEGQSVEAGSL